MSTELTTESAIEYLQDVGLLGPDATGTVDRLGGGVSNEVLRVKTREGNFVLKQALGRLRVKDEWLADAERINTEYAFAKLVADRISPHFVPKPLLLDAANHIFVLELAPETHEPWKARLLRGECEEHVAQAAGSLLAQIHNLSLHDNSLPRRFDNALAFDQLRIDPYLRATAQRNPDRGPILETLAQHLATTRVGLVHGDYSPKNMLTDGHEFLLIDHEVATWGEPWFDVAFLTNHLLLKSIKRPQDAAAYVALAKSMWAAYQDRVDPHFLDREADLVPWLVGALMLARVDGKSPVEYLDETRQDETRRRARTLLTGPPKTLDALLDTWNAPSAELPGTGR